ncbi:catalase-like [Bicyclus anynana]|uniref:Catalase-like n=1 Tax=Bicyclus anynana TaxID=110368 RepID=A0ABM3LHM7_BICAN|nr:catalase-like [Bicyclus anynana]
MFALLLLMAASAAATEYDLGPEFGGDLCYAQPFEEPITNNAEFVNDITAMVREKIPERVVHAKGTGAFGYFELTHDMSRYCRADFLRGVGKRTPVAVRFSTGAGERGSSDFIRDTRGFAVKFYTKEGNCDMVGFHTEMYFYSDPHRFTTVVHGVKKKPDSGMYDYDTYFDAITELPETCNFFVNLYSSHGIPLNYRHMPGFPIHTYQLVNSCGEYYFSRFHYMPDLGVKTLKTMDALTLSSTDPDYSVRDLYEAIQRGDYPSWTVYAQILTMKDVKKHGAKVFDVTRSLSIDDFPLLKIGKLVLNKNAKHFDKEIDQLAMNPGNVVNGILGAPDKLFESRSFLYRDAQYHRLGKNHNKIPVNCPLHKILTYNRDGMYPVGDNEGSAPNYYPNTFGGPQPFTPAWPSNCTRKYRKEGLIQITESPAYNSDQIVEFYNQLTDEGRQILCDNLVMVLKTTSPRIQKKSVYLFGKVHEDLARRLAKGFNSTVSNYE